MSPPHPRTILPGSPDWPQRLLHLDRPPQALWVWGARPPSERCVAVVGSRRATPAGLSIAREIGAQLAGMGVTVVSGMARGIDAASHLGALDAGGDTTAVLGCGIDCCYPPEHADLRRRIVEQGWVVSEEERATEPFKGNFPKRNRLIAALALAVVVVEATARSGALSTARWAADLGRDVLAVPGSIRAPQSHGTNLLIRDGAAPFLSIADLFRLVPALGPASAAGPGVEGGDDRAGGLSRPLQEILQRMGATPVHPDEIGRALGLPASRLAAGLGELELRGAVLSLPGGLVARTF